MRISPDDFSALSGRLARAVPCLSGALSVSDESVFCEGAGPVTLLYIIEDCDADETTLRVEDIEIGKDSRGQGLGSAILREVIGFCRERRFDINLSASPPVDRGEADYDEAFVRLVGFYERLGFSDETPAAPFGNMIIRNASPSPKLQGSPMRSFIRENTDRFMIEVFGGGNAVLVTDKGNGVSAHMQGEDADDFLKSLEDIGVAYQAPSSVWHKATWNDCLAQISDEIILAQNPDYAEWRDAATALGWKVVEKDPSAERAHDGPCLFHEGQDRAMPIGFWREAVIDMGYESPEEARLASDAPAP